MIPLCFVAHQNDLEWTHHAKAIIECINFRNKVKYFMNKYVTLYDSHKENALNDNCMDVRNINMNAMCYLSDTHYKIIGFDIIHQIKVSNFIDIIYTDRYNTVCTSKNNYICMSSYPLESAIPYIYFESAPVRSLVYKKSNRNVVVFIENQNHVENVHYILMNNGDFTYTIYHNENIDVSFLKRPQVKVKRGLFDSHECINDLQTCCAFVCTYNSRYLSHLIYHKIPVITMGIPHKFMHPIIHEWYDDIDLNDVIKMNESGYTQREYDEFITWIQNTSIVLKRLLLN